MFLPSLARIRGSGRARRIANAARKGTGGGSAEEFRTANET